MYFLQIVDSTNVKNAFRQKCIESVKRFVTNDDSYVLKEIKFNVDQSVMINEIDKIRFSYAREFDDLFYIDTDCFLSNRPEISAKDKVIVGETVSEDGVAPDMFMFYVNGRKDFFAQNYNTLIEKRTVYNLLEHQIQLLSGETGSFDRLSYFHMSLSNIELSINQQLNIFSNKIIEQEKEINAYRNAIQGMKTTIDLFDDLRKRENKNG